MCCKKHCHIARSSEVHQLKNDTDKLSLCYRGGRKGHLHTKCKFKFATCHIFGKIGHIKPVCHSRNSSRLQRSSTSIFHHPSTISSPRPTTSSPCSSDTSNRQLSDSSIRHHLSRSSAAHSSVKQLEKSGLQVEYALFTVPSGTRVLCMPLLLLTINH